MHLILSLESSTAVCSVAIHNDGMLVDSIFISEPRAASARLLVEANELLKKNSIKPKDLAAIAISSGPGSYTGLRISTSAAKGLCYALNLPLIAINSLGALAHEAKKTIHANLYCPMIDARRMEVYTMLLDENLNQVLPTEAKILSANSFEKELNSNKTAFFGDGSEKLKPLINHPNAIFVGDVHPQAKELGELAFGKFKKNQFEDVANFEPMYLKEFMIKKAVSTEQKK